MATATSRLQIIIDVLTGQSKQAVAGVEKAIKGIATSAASAAAAAAIMGTTFKKAFELGKEGAAIKQTTESFDMLLEKVGAAPALLDDLKRATGGTISDMELMSSTATLLAGASGELGTALANNTPQLMEIARAANKLNPTLGDTTYMYESLAAGIKRSSPLILDNLGLTIKIGEANQKMADQLGKSVQELTAEEQKMALLNATLEAGQVLIDQVGGNIESATDSFSRMEASVSNASDALKARFAPSVANAADAIYLLLEGHNLLMDAMQNQSNELIKASVSYEEYVDNMVNSAAAIYKINPAMAEQIKLALKTGEAMDEAGNMVSIYSKETYALMENLGILTRAAYENGASMVDLDDKLAHLDQNLKGTVETTEEYESVLPRLVTGNKELAQSSLTASQNTHKLGEALEEVNNAAAATAEGMGRYFDMFNQDMSDMEMADKVQQAFTDHLVDLALSGQLTADQLAGLQGALAEIDPTAAGALEQSLALAQGLDALTQAALETGDWSGFTEGLDYITNFDTGTVNNLAMSIDGVQQSLQNTHEPAEGLQTRLEQLTEHPWNIEVNVVYNDPGWQAPSGVNPGYTGGTMNIPQGATNYQGHARGADFIVPPGYPNDSYPMWVQSGEHVQVTPANQTTNKNSVNIQSVTFSQPMTPDSFRAFLMEALRG